MKIRSLIAAATITTATVVPAAEVIEQVLPQPTVAAWSLESAAACRALHGVYVNNRCPGGNPDYQASCRVTLIYGYGEYYNTAWFMCYVLSHGGSSS